jgi:thiosulfate/3-mercaptopyruvate sulfurtransferase
VVERGATLRGMSWAHPEYLVETDWLAANLEDPALRVLECTTILHPRPDGGYKAESGRATWAAGHIPRSGFADLTDDLCDRTASWLYMMPEAEAMAAAMARLGVGEGTRVVLYDRVVNMWAARVWWMLRAVGFDRAAVLNGGWKKWTLEGRPTSTDPCVYPPRASSRPRPRSSSAGRGAPAWGSAPRASSTRCPKSSIAAPAASRTGSASPAGSSRAAHSARRSGDARVPRARRAAEAFAASGALAAGRVITYCGGGIAASSDAFVLTLLGHDQVSVYDASLSEWASIRPCRWRRAKRSHHGHEEEGHRADDGVD